MFTGVEAVANDILADSLYPACAMWIDRLSKAAMSFSITSCSGHQSVCLGTGGYRWMHCPLPHRVHDRGGHVVSHRSIYAYWAIKV